MARLRSKARGRQGVVGHKVVSLLSSCSTGGPVRFRWLIFMIIQDKNHKIGI